MKLITYIVLIVAYYVLNKRFHKRRNDDHFPPCKYSLISNDCKKYQNGKSLACDQKTSTCRLANGEECNTGERNDGYDHSGCLSGSVCDGTAETHYWGKCVNQESLGTKFQKALFHVTGIKGRKLKK